MNNRKGIFYDLLIEHIKKDKLDKMAQYLDENGFFTAPASAGHHGAHEGGLFDHSLAVTQALLKLTRNNNLVWQRPESPYLVGMFHDLCKIDSYKWIQSEATPITGNIVMQREDGHWEYNENTKLKGHGDKSVMLLSMFTALTEEEIMCIRYHMGAFVDKSEWSLYSKAVNLFPNVLFTHTADMIASQVEGV
ncbi:MAG: hypothetical protein WHF31_16200 [Candidatus Dehalobacter alkaniphilus]